jgi:hypothetical protein
MPSKMVNFFLEFCGILYKENMAVKKVRNSISIEFRKHPNRRLKGQFHEKVGELRIWGVSLSPN